MDLLKSVLMQINLQSRHKMLAIMGLLQARADVVILGISYIDELPCLALMQMVVVKFLFTMIIAIHMLTLMSVGCCFPT